MDRTQFQPSTQKLGLKQVCRYHQATVATPRRTYHESIAYLRSAQILGADESSPMPKQTPQPEDDEPLGLSFFRTRLAKASRIDLSNLSLPRTFFGRSEIRDVSFRNTDLSESNLYPVS